MQPSTSTFTAIQLSVRAAVSAGLAVGIAQFLELQYPIYALIAAVIVIDLSPVKTRQLALQRLIGTLLGATVGAALSYVLPAGPLAIMISILAAMLLTYVARVPAAAKLAGYVCGIVILSHGANPWSYALYRVVETFLGLAMAVLVSLVPKLMRVETADWEIERRSEHAHHLKLFCDWLCLNAAQPLALRIVHADVSQYSRYSEHR